MARGQPSGKSDQSLKAWLRVKRSSALCSITMPPSPIVIEEFPGGRKVIISAGFTVPRAKRRARAETCAVPFPSPSTGIDHCSWAIERRF